MTTRTILLTFAASVAPLYAQQPICPAPAAEVFTALAAPAEAATASPEQRAKVFNALALLPADISDFVVLTQVGGNLLALAESGCLPELEAADVPAELLALDNIALATSPATPATYALLQHALVSLSTLGSTMELAQEWGSAAREGLRDAIVESLLLHADARAALPEGMAEGAHIPASYVVLTSRAGEEEMLQEAYELLLADLQNSDKPGVTAVSDANGFSGVSINVVETYAAELEAATKDMAPRRKEQLLAELGRHPLHLLARRQGNALIVALCEDPQELRLAATPAESLLGTDVLAGCDGLLGKRMIAASHTSAQLAAVGQAVNAQPTYELAAAIGSVFSRLAEQEPEQKEVYEKAAAAVALLNAELQRMSRPVERPTTMQLWSDGHLHLALRGDAQGCGYRKGQLRLATMADAPKTSLYMESTPTELGMTPPESKELLNAAMDAAEGFVLSLASEERAQAATALATVKAFMPELQALAAAGSTVGDGLNGQLALVMDSEHGQLPRPPQGTAAGVEADVPRFAIYAGVSDRNKLSEGWEALRAGAGQVAAKFGMPPEVVNMLPIATRQAGAVTSYSVSLPFFTQDAVPSLAVTDTGVALGSSVNLTTQVAESATGTTPFAGAVFALRFAPLARTLRSLATALDADAEEAEPVASSELRLEREKGEPVACIGGANGPTTLFICSGNADAADQLSTAAAIFEYASTIAEGVYGAATVEDGQHVLRVDIRMK